MAQGTSGNHFLNLGTGTGKPKKLSRCFGQGRDEQETIPVVWDGNRKTQLFILLTGMGTGTLIIEISSQIKYFCNININSK